MTKGPLEFTSLLYNSNTLLEIFCFPSSVVFLELWNTKQLLDEVFVISGIIKVEVSVISRAEGRADNTYRDLDYLGYRENRI